MCVTVPVCDCVCVRLSDCKCLYIIPVKSKLMYEFIYLNFFYIIVYLIVMKAFCAVKLCLLCFDLLYDIIDVCDQCLCDMTIQHFLRDGN